MLGRGCGAGLQVKHRHNDLQVPCVSGVRTVAAVTRREDKTASPALNERFKLPGPQAGVPAGRVSMCGRSRCSGLLQDAARVIDGWYPTAFPLDLIFRLQEGVASDSFKRERNQAGKFSVSSLVPVAMGE
jgi:hypothetical protein